MLAPARPSPDMLVLLRGVSRSFYLSIRVLPAPLRRPIAVAYLLARATDTIADTAVLSADERLAKLSLLASAIQAGSTVGIGELASFFSALQTDAAERALINALPYCFEWMHQLDSADRSDVREVLRHITRGQVLDVERFAKGGPLHALETQAQLHEYTYLVAGCVGEFWTELGFRHLRNFARQQKETMRGLGREYGMGLQLVNILRDLHADLAAGRCYFAASELAAAGLTPVELSNAPQAFTPIWDDWLALAQRRMTSGLQYADAVNSRRVRVASALPALIGVRTLALLKARGPRASAEKLKVPRAQVRSILARLALTLGSRETITAMGQ
jgi:farnesyl-diphosphate farnesyltransferase